MFISLRNAVMVIYTILALFVLIPTLSSLLTSGSAYTFQPVTYQRALSNSSCSPDNNNPTSKPTPTSNAPLLDVLSAQFREKVKSVFEGVEAVVLMDHPEYRNRGDSALYLGEVHFLRSMNIPIIYECSYSGMITCDTDWVNKILDDKTGLVCFSGGGNFGDLWPWLREAKEKWLLALDRYKVFQFPQTVHFKDMDVARQSAALWAAHPRVTVSVRDQESVDFMEQYFPTTPVVLVPDAAFLIGPVKRAVPKVDLMWLMRQDKETAQSITNYTELVQYIHSIVPRSDITVVVDDWLELDTPILPDMGEGVLTRRAYARTMDGVNILSSGKVVVSDRLHAHVLSTIADVPHVILDNENGKVYHVHEAWTKSAIGIKLAKNVEDAMIKAVELLDEYNAKQSVKEGVTESVKEGVTSTPTV